jgi:hypothetical protein
MLTAMETLRAHLTVGIHHEQSALAVRVVEKAAENNLPSQVGARGGGRFGGRRLVGHWNDCLIRSRPSQRTPRLGDPRR